MARQEAKYSSGSVKYPKSMYEYAKDKIIFTIVSALYISLKKSTKSEDSVIAAETLRVFSRVARKFGVKPATSLQKLGLVYTETLGEAYVLEIPEDFSGLPDSYLKYYTVNKQAPLYLWLSLHWLGYGPAPQCNSLGAYFPDKNAIVIAPTTRKHTAFTNATILSVGDTLKLYKGRLKEQTPENYKKYAEAIKNYENNYIIGVIAEINDILEILQHELRHYVQYTMLHPAQTTRYKGYIDRNQDYYISPVEFGPSSNTIMARFTYKILSKLNYIKNSEPDIFKMFKKTDLDELVRAFIGISVEYSKTNRKYMQDVIQELGMYGATLSVIKPKPSAYKKAVASFMTKYYPEIVRNFYALKRGKASVITVA